ncbi:MULTISPECIES: sugar transporter [Vibrio]|uniref:Sugar transporter n=1 Tax=Vibrio casei TaxID=673372 RepID=A0A368LI64_9VIBR|nr:MULTISPECIES: sugar transporter [Vibrio]RCS70407.1 sugar transporter [Vibrio casei]SJN20677.1 Sugar efflux transporter SotB [Vibrio casei]HBV77041.1 sugar transporter [Vibrio sp.]
MTQPIQAEMTSRRIQYLRVFAMGISAFIFNTTEFVPVGILSDIAQSFSISTAQAGWMITIYAWVVAGLSLPLMLLTGRIERKTLLLGVFTVFVVSHVLSVIAWSYTVLMISRIGIALAHAIFWSITASIAIRVAPAGKKTLALSVLATGTSLAMVLGVPLGRLIDQWFGWRVTFAVIGMTALALMVILWRILPTLPSLSNGSLKKLPRLLKNPILIGAYAFTFLMFTAHYTAYSYIEPFLRDVGSSTAYFTTFILLLFGGAGIIGSMMFSYWGETKNTHLLLLGTGSMLFSLLLLLTVIHSPMLLSIVMVVWGVALMLVVLTMQVKVFNIDNDAFEVIMSMFSGIINLGIGAGALIGSQVILAWSLPNVGYAASLVAVFGLALIVALLYRYPTLRK